MGRNKKQTRLDAFLRGEGYVRKLGVDKSESDPRIVGAPDNTSQDMNRQVYLDHREQKIGDVGEYVSIFLRNIKLPEIMSPKMPRYRLDEISRHGRRILVVTEKPKVAVAFARALGGKNFRRMKHGRVVVYSLRYRDFFVTILPLRGHIIEYDTKHEYRSWSTVDPLEIIKRPDSLVQKYRYPAVARLLRDLARKHDVLFIATDADEEGENIGWEAIQIVRRVKNMPVYRLWFLSTQPSELLSAFSNPTKPIFSWALAPEARKIIDAFSGFSSTRELTSIGKRAGGLMKILMRNNILSLGRVQSPTLYLLYLRERYIRNFKPKPYWSLVAILHIGGHRIAAEHIKSPFHVFEEANKTYRKIVAMRKAVVEKVEQERKRRRPEPPLNTNRALIMLNKILKLPSNRAMKILEDLYLEGLITYPRTDTDRYPDNYDHSRNLKRLTQHQTLGRIAARVLSRGARLRRNGSKLIGDHLPITPIDVPKKGTKLSDVHLRVYDLIVRRYLALFMDDAILEKNRAIISIGGEGFVLNFTRIVQDGFFEVYPYTRPESKDIHIHEGLSIPVERIQLLKKMTKPPSRLSEAELLRYMERLGLGTKATRPEHIQKLISRKYVVRKKGRLYLTELGYKICEFLEKIWPEFLRPYFSAYVLSLLRRIMNNELRLEEAIADARKKFLELFLRLRRSRTEFRRILSTISDINIGKRRK